MGKLGTALLVMALGLSACGYTDLSRSATGAIAGGVIAAATDNDVATGVIVGGAAGALCDEVTPGICR